MNNPIVTLKPMFGKARHGRRYQDKETVAAWPMTNVEFLAYINSLVMGDNKEATKGYLVEYKKPIGIGHGIGHPQHYGGIDWMDEESFNARYTVVHDLYSESIGDKTVNIDFRDESKGKDETTPSEDPVVNHFANGYFESGGNRYAVFEHSNKAFVIRRINTQTDALTYLNKAYGWSSALPYAKVFGEEEIEGVFNRLASFYFTLNFENPNAANVWDWCEVNGRSNSWWTCTVSATNRITKEEFLMTGEGLVLKHLAGTLPKYAENVGDSRLVNDAFFPIIPNPLKFEFICALENHPDIAIGLYRTTHDQCYVMGIDTKENSYFYLDENGNKATRNDATLFDEEEAVELIKSNGKNYEIIIHTKGANFLSNGDTGQVKVVGLSDPQFGSIVFANPYADLAMANVGSDVYNEIAILGVCFNVTKKQDFTYSIVKDLINQFSFNSEPGKPSC